MQKPVLLSVSSVLSLLLGCGPAAQQPQVATTGLGGTSWRLVEFQGGDDRIMRPDDRSKYTIEFATDGAVIARIDCNRGRSTWRSGAPAALELGPLALTRAMCPSMALHD